jgi:hypothetical protein
MPPAFQSAVLDRWRSRDLHKRNDRSIATRCVTLSSPCVHSQSLGQELGGRHRAQSFDQLDNIDVAADTCAAPRRALQVCDGCRLVLRAGQQGGRPSVPTETLRTEDSICTAADAPEKVFFNLAVSR